MPDVCAGVHPNSSDPYAPLFYSGNAPSTIFQGLNYSQYDLLYWMARLYNGGRAIDLSQAPLQLNVTHPEELIQEFYTVMEERPAPQPAALHYGGGAPEPRFQPSGALTCWFRLVNFPSGWPPPPTPCSCS